MWSSSACLCIVNMPLMCKCLEFKVWSNTLNALSCFQPAAEVVSYSESSYLSINRYLHSVFVEAGVKQQDLHEILSMRRQELFLRGLS